MSTKVDKVRSTSKRHSRRECKNNCESKSKPKESCCEIINDCNFNDVRAVLSFATGVPILTMSGLNGPSVATGACGCDARKSLCKQISACNKFQLVSVSATIDGVVTPVPILLISNNSGGQLLAQLQDIFRAGVPVAFTVTLNNPIRGCQGTVSGISI